ncbi:MAG: alpha/beta fold hydrolase [Bryobacteraceae bacterium]
MPRLSSPIEDIQDHYTVVVIGSGYGGGIAASRMARAGQSVCVLERGKEFQPGEYPDTEGEALLETQVRTPEGTVGSKTGLYDFVVGDGINVFLGCGLGGTSLVNANVSLEAEPRVFQDARWPAQVRQDLPTLVQQGYDRAREMLKPTPFPESLPPLPKMGALEKSAQYLEQKFYRTPINVTFETKVNHVGVPQNACTMCGDCVTGCNYGAKNTTLMNYLPDARNFGAEIFTQVPVRYIERREGKWFVHYQPLHEGREDFNAPDMFVTADIVMLGAGTLGSTEILLRSKAEGLPVSECVGERFSGNGDVLGFSYNGDQEVNGIGFGHRKPGEIPPVGPCITGVIDIRNQPKLEDGMIVEEGSVPGALAGLMPGALETAAKTAGKNTDTSLGDLIEQKKRELESLVGGAHRGAVHNTQTYLVMTHDSGDGKMRLENDRLKLEWPGVGKELIFDKVNETLLNATTPLEGTYVIDPLWTKLFKKDLVTVHPLGGCVMADDASSGVVNHKGQVYAGASGSETYDSLYVCDGSVIPVPLGVNPLLTISAMAERTCAIAAQDRGWKIDYALPSKPAVVAQSAAMGLQFTETMRGFFSSEAKGDYVAGAAAGEAAGSSLAFTLTIISEDLNDMLKNPLHNARMLGSVVAPALSARPLSVEDGVFNLFVVDPTNVETRNMVYRMKMRSEEGKVYYFHGYKIVRPNSVLDIWHDTSTLYITVRDGADESAPVLGTGILHILPSDFARQMTTMKVTNAPNAEERLRGLVRFGEFFAGVLYQTYGGAVAGSVAFNPDAPPRKKRELRVAAPEVYWFDAPDGVTLRLTRYQGGTKGPVILSHGLGVSSLIFSTDTIDTNLTEYLFAHGYDVWLLDYRDSIALPASASLSSGDDVATKDYPAAVAKVRELTGAPSVQMVVHCWGSTTFFMAMLAGLQGVRSAVCSQIATHIVTPTMTKIKTGLHLPSFLDALGVKSLTAYVDTHADWREHLYDAALKLYPVELKEECDSPVCHRISFMYAPLYQHEQLNQLTHDTLHELFGVANIRSFEHIALLARKGHLVAFDGSDTYMPHLERLAIPITFIHGAANRCFLPQSTEITYNLLCQTNGDKLYSRHVIPNYGHIDCIYGRNAVNDIFPLMLSHLDATCDAPAALQAAR